MLTDAAESQVVEPEPGPLHTSFTALASLGVETQRQPAWPWRVGFVLESDDLANEITGALAEMNATCEMKARATAPPFEIAALVERHRPDVIFVELACVDIPAVDWIGIVRSGAETPLIIAVHRDAEPSEMISALRAGAAEFLSLPVRPNIFEAMDRIGTQLEARLTTTSAPGKLVGILSPKGGCGATTLACHLAIAMQMAQPSGKVLLTDLDHQSPSVHKVCRADARAGVKEAFDSVRRLNSAWWGELVRPVAASVDMLAGSPGNEPAEAWRVENLFRFVRRHYTWILADLGRHLNPCNWSSLSNVNELLVVTAPDVLALYQTRSLLQILTSRGFEKSRVQLILNKNQNSPQDFWIESIEQMFDMNVLSVLPHDPGTLGRVSRGPFEFPANSAYGRSVAKLAARILQSNDPEVPKKAA